MKANTFKVGDRIFQTQRGRCDDPRIAGNTRSWRLYGEIIEIREDGRLRIQWNPKGRQMRKLVWLPSKSVELVNLRIN